MRLTGRPQTQVGCFAYADALAFPTAHPAGPGGSVPAIFISVDGPSAGVRRDPVENDLAGDYTHFRRFGHEGVITFNVRSDSTHTRHVSRPHDHLDRPASQTPCTTVTQITNMPRR